MYGVPKLVVYVPPANTMKWMFAMRMDDAFLAFSAGEDAVFTIEESVRSFVGAGSAGG